MKKLIILGIFSFIIIGKTSAQTQIAAKDAAKHIGDSVSITDKVFGGKLFTPSNMTLLDIGGYNPNQLLTIMIPGADRGKFKGQPEVDYKGRNVTVIGKLILYKNKPEIVVTDPKQLSLVLTDNKQNPPLNQH